MRARKVATLFLFTAYRMKTPPRAKEDPHCRYQAWIAVPLPPLNSRPPSANTSARTWLCVCFESLCGAAPARVGFGTEFRHLLLLPGPRRLLLKARLPQR